MFVDSVIIGIIIIAVAVAVAVVIMKAQGGSLPGTDQQVVDHLHDGGVPRIGGVSEIHRAAFAANAASAATGMKNPPMMSLIVCHSLSRSLAMFVLPHK
jgi:hypothetical protein